MNKIEIYGEIVPSSFGGDGYSNLTTVSDQLKSATGDIEVLINSFGGDVDEGFAIYTALRRYADDNKAEVTTRAVGRCSSIATVIFLSGDTRIANQYIEPFVHNAWMYAVGDSNEINRVSVELEKVNDRIAKFYSEHTTLTYDEARELMDADTFITPEEALNIRFATAIEQVSRPAALQRINQKSNKMSKTDDKDLLAKIKKIFAMESPKNAVEVFTSTNEALVFPDLEEGQSPKVGDKATIDGKAAEGSYTLQSGVVYVFAAGVLESITEQDDDGDDEMEALKRENAELKEKLNAQAKKITSIEAKVQDTETKIKDSESILNKLKETFSDYVVDDKDNKDRTPKNEKTGLAAAVSKLNSKTK